MFRAVTYFQNMPEKTIKHGINVIAICCDLPVILPVFKVYVGQEDDSNNTAMGTCEELVKETGQNSVIERTLYTDKWQTSMVLARHNSTSTDRKFLVILYHQTRSCMIIRILISSSCKCSK